MLDGSADSPVSSRASRLACGKVEGGMTPAIALDARPGGPTAKRQPSPEGLGNDTEEGSSAVGAALNRTVS
jgi:hypothetical protein